MTRALRIIRNRPGLAAIAYRIASHGRFKANLLANLAAEPALRGLTTRSDDDFAIALLDAWSCAADVITFYQERLANESWLRTASERQSLGYLARLLGSELGPGVAAGCPVVFTVDALSSKNQPVPLPPGLKLQSFPAPGEPPQTFELDAPISVRAAHNELRPSNRTPTPEPSFTVRVPAATLADFTAADGRRHPLLILGRNQLGTVLPARRILRDYQLRADNDAALLTWTGRDLEPDPSSILVILGRRADLRTVSPANTDNEVRLGLTPPPGAPLPLFSPFVLVDARGSESYVPVDLLQTVDALAITTTLEPGRRPPADFIDPIALLPSRIVADPQPAATRLLVAGQVRAGDLVLARLTADPQRWRAAVVAAATPRGDSATDLLIPQWLSSHRLPPPGPEDMFVLRGRAALFGHNAPDANLLTATSPALTEPAEPASTGFEWKTFAVGAADPLDLDAVYPALQVGDPIVIRQGQRAQLAFIAAVDTASRAGFSLGARVSRVTLRDPQGPGLDTFSRRLAEVHLAPEPLTLVGPVRTDPVAGATIDLHGALPDLTADRTILVTGPRLADDLQARELATIAASSIRDDITTLTLRAPLAHSYRRDAVIVRANLGFASHGETVRETLGSGDASAPLQRFALKQSPLTFLPAATARGRVSTLTVTVDGDLWREVDSFEGASPRDRIFTVALTATGGAVVQFGDGTRGARLPTGTANVQATYRRGIGLAGNIPADQLALLATPTLGVIAVTNPLPASGAAPPDDLADVRRNAPLPVRTLGRVVSLRDYEDFARAFTGVAKAHAVAFRDGTRPGVLVTVAGSDGAPIPLGTATAEFLLAALRGAGDPHVTVRLHSHDPAATPRPTFTFAGTVTAAPDRDIDRLRADLRAALVARFGFTASEFARPIFRSAVIAAIQAVPGVVAVDLTSFARTGDIPDPATVRLLATVAARPQDPPTELLTLDPAAPARLEVLR